MKRRLQDKIVSSILFLIAVGFILIVGVNIGRYLEREDKQSALTLCNRYVAVLGQGLEEVKRANRILIGARREANESFPTISPK